MNARSKLIVTTGVTLVVVTALSVVLGFLWDAVLDSEDLAMVFKIASGLLLGWVGAGLAMDWHRNWTRR